MILTATVVPLRHHHARVCNECRKPIEVRALRVAEKEDNAVSVVYYHPHDEEDLEQHACAPRHPLVHAALRRKAVAP